MTLARAGFPLEAVRGLGDRFAALPRPRRWAAAASLGWGVLVAAYGVGFLSASAGQARGTLFLDAMFFLVALALPVLLVWLAAWLAEELEQQREVVAALAEVTAPLIGALAAAREALDRHGPASPEAIERAVRAAVLGSRPDLAVPLDRLLTGQARIEAALQKLAAAPRPPRLRLQPAPAPAPAAVAETAPRARSGARRAVAAPARGGDPGAAGLGRPGARPRLPARRRGQRRLPGAALGAAPPWARADAAGGRGRAEPPVAGGRLRRRAADGAGRRGRLAQVHRRRPRPGGRRPRRHPRPARDRGGARADEVRLDLPRLGAVLPAPLRRACSASSPPTPTTRELEELAGTRSGRAFMLLARLNGSLD